MRVALDANILAYAEGANGSAMRNKALGLIQRLPPDAIVLPVQTGASCSAYSSEKLIGGHLT